MSRRNHYHCACVLWTAVLAIPAAAVADECENGICLVDRGARGEIVLGAYQGGLGVIDYDNDGYMDLVIADSAGKSTRLFHNVASDSDPQERTFEEVTAGSGLDDADGTARDGGGVLVADYDNDGYQDVFIVGQSGSSGCGLLYRNNGDGTFTNVSKASGARRDWTDAESAAWVDFDLDGNLDLMVTRKVAPFVHLLRNNGDGTLADVSNILPTITGFTHSYSNGWMDYDRDGYPDCFLLSNKGAGTDVLLHNIDDGAGGRKFVNVAEDVGYVKLGPAPMGIAFGDFDNDGDLDIGISDGLFGTYFENTGGAFKQITPFATMFGWGVDWVDVDNDGWLDFYTAGSWSKKHLDNLQLNRGDGTFRDVSPLLNGISAASRYSVQVDFNNDGRTDIITMAPGDFVSVYENTSTTENHWLRLVLRGDGGWINRDAVGAFIRLTADGRTQVRETADGSSTTATEDLRPLFGLGGATQVEQIEVVWPRRGSIAARTAVYAGPFAADQTLTLEPPDQRGDLNCDGQVDFDDIDPFVQALTAPQDYGQAYPDCYVGLADINRDGDISFNDIDPFVALLLK